MGSSYMSMRLSTSVNFGYGRALSLPFPCTWRSSRAFSGGTQGSLASHIVDSSLLVYSLPPSQSSCFFSCRFLSTSGLPPFPGPITMKPSHGPRVLGSLQRIVCDTNYGYGRKLPNETIRRGQKSPLLVRKTPICRRRRGETISIGVSGL